VHKRLQSPLDGIINAKANQVFPTMLFFFNTNGYCCRLCRIIGEQQEPRKRTAPKSLSGSVSLSRLKTGRLDEKTTWPVPLELTPSSLFLLIIGTWWCSLSFDAFASSIATSRGLVEYLLSRCNHFPPHFPYEPPTSSSFLFPTKNGSETVAWVDVTAVVVSADEGQFPWKKY
jgi:hypothetical protein